MRLNLLPGGSKALRHSSPVHFHLGAVDVTARVALLEGDALAHGENTRAQIVLDRAIGTLRGDRFIIRDQSASHTLGGGTVLDPFPPARKRRTPERLAILAALEQTIPEAALSDLLDASPGGVDLARFALASNLTAAESEALSQRVATVVSNGAAFSQTAWLGIRQSVLTHLAETHRQSPDSLGPAANQLRMRVAPGMKLAVFNGLLSQLCAEGVVAKSGPWLHLPNHRITLAAGDLATWQKAKPLLLEQPFQPPRVRDLANALNIAETRMRILLQQLAAMGEVYRVAHDHYFMPEVVEELTGIAREIAAKQHDGKITAALFRDRIGTGRKLAIQILEFFDANALTRRAGDAHYLR